MNKVSLAAYGAALMCWCGCTDFYGVGLGYGGSESRDTVLVPQDTVSLPSGYGRYDTLFYSDFQVKPGRRVTFSFFTGAFAGDSVALQASFVSNGLLSISLQDSSEKPWPYALSQGVQDTSVRQILLSKLEPKVLYTLSWVWGPGMFNSRGMLAVGYAPAVATGALSSYTLVESQALPPGRPHVLENGTWTWQLMPVLEGDTLTVHVAADTALKAYVLDGAGMDYFNRNMRAPTATLYERTRQGDSAHIRIERSETLYWLLHNPTAKELSFQDSLLSRQSLLP